MVISRPATLTTTLYVNSTDMDEAALASLNNMLSIPKQNYDIQFDEIGDVDFDIQEVAIN